MNMGGGFGEDGPVPAKPRLAGGKPRNSIPPPASGSPPEETTKNSVYLRPRIARRR